MICLKQIRLYTTIYTVVLLNLTGIMYQTIVEADVGDYNVFVTSTSMDNLSLLASAELMKNVETKCEKDKSLALLDVPQKVDINELSMVQIKLENGKTVNEYTKVSDLNKIDKNKLYAKTEDVVVIIPGYQTSIKKDTPHAVVKLVWTLQNGRKDDSIKINIFVLDVGEHFSKAYNYEQCILKVPIIGQYLGKSLAKMRTEKKIHLIGIDIGASVAGVAGTYYENAKISKISRISALNPATLCLKNFLTKDSAGVVDVYIGSNFYDATTGNIGTKNFQIRDNVEKNSCNRLVCTTAQVLNYFTDSLLKENNKFILKKCSDDKPPVCETDVKYTTDFGYLEPTKADEFQIILASNYSSGADSTGANSTGNNTTNDNPSGGNSTDDNPSSGNLTDGNPSSGN